MKTDVGIGQDIMIRSFRTIEKELKNKEIPLDKKWALLHAIHTTADFDMENILRIDDHAVASLYGKFSRGEVRTIITDVTTMGWVPPSPAPSPAASCWWESAWPHTGSAPL